MRHGGTWDLPGSALDSHEDSIAGALREARERGRRHACRAYGTRSSLERVLVVTANRACASRYRAWAPAVTGPRWPHDAAVNVLRMFHIEADNASAFNCRQAEGSSNWSQHAYGRAVDINPRENPYRYANGSVSHKNARKFANRPVNAPGVVNPGDRVVKAFAKVGWEWGGIWSGIKDFQHFSKGGG